jgi:hypothetical protein
MILQEKCTMDYLASAAFYMPPDPPSPPNKASLTAALKLAVRDKNAEAARQIFDMAFWNNIELIPDWHNLLVAVSLKDRPMIRLLASHGAGWTEEETRCLKEIFPAQWPEFTATLRASGLQVPQDAQASPPDTCVLVTMMKDLLSSAKDDPREMGFTKSKSDVDDLLSKGIIRSLAQGQTARALRLLHLRQPAGAVDFSREFKGLLLQNGARNAVDILERLHAGRDTIKPVTIDFIIAKCYPEAVAMLNRRGLLATEQPQRMCVIEAWAEMRHERDYKAAASILFGSGPSATTAEVEWFTGFYQKAVAKGLPGINEICDKLKEMGFFDARAWTKERLQVFVELAPESSSLKHEFNKKLAYDRFGRMNAKEILKPENCAAFLEAHRKGYYQATSRQTSEIILSLSSQYTRSPVPDAVKEDLRTLKNGNAHFSTYIYLGERKNLLGKREPGMAKVLLDLDILKPDDFFLFDLREKANLPAAKDRLYWEKNPGAYGEFYFQVYLEQSYPKEFIPQRGKISSYHEAFKAKLFGQTPPPRPPKMRNKWFW